MAVEEVPKPVVALAATAKEPFLANGVGDLLEQHSSTHRVYRITAWVVRFIRNCRCVKDKRQSGPITIDEFLTAENCWLKEVQQRHFSKEIECCNGSDWPKILPKGSKLVGLSPFVDGDGLLRCNGRLENANIPFGTSHPIALDANCLLA